MTVPVLAAQAGAHLAVLPHAAGPAVAGTLLRPGGCSCLLWPWARCFCSPAWRSLPQHALQSIAELPSTLHHDHTAAALHYRLPLRCFINHHHYDQWLLLK